VSNGGAHGSKGSPSGRGVTVTTKGMITQSVPVPALPAPRPDADPLNLSLSQDPVRIVVPTAINVVLMAMENIIDNMRVQQPASLSLPSMYKRAFLVAYETDEIAVVTP